MAKKKAIEIKAPELVTIKAGFKNIFLAGSIEMGKADDWQAQIISELSDENIIFMNPRRESWDSSWKQDMSNPQFVEQVTWELKGLEMADLIVIYIDPQTKSPITLLELGLHAKSGKVVMLCPKGFYRKGNIDVTCAFYNVPQVKSFEELYNYVRYICND